MTNLDEKNKYIIPITDNYTLDIFNDSHPFDKKNVSNHKKVSKKTDNEPIHIPTIQTYQDMSKHKYSITQLKMFAKHYKLKLSGNKSELIDRIYTFLSLSFHIIKIQKIFRGFIIRKYKSLHGPAYKDRTLCTNCSDFVTMESLTEINLHQFFSFTDDDGFIYGFDINSLYNMIYKHKETKNPYNRNTISETVLKNIRKMIRFSKLLKINLNLEIEDDLKNISTEKAIELRVLSLFQNIDALGNYSNPQWFLSLSRNHIIKFIRELIDIWDYRAQLSMEIKRNIFPPYGDPFRNLSLYYIQTEQDIHNIRKIVIQVLENFVNSGIDRDSQSLGAYYVLGALTLVNYSAANALPWLYQSLCYQ